MLCNNSTQVKTYNWPSHLKFINFLHMYFTIYILNLTYNIETY